MDALNFYQLPLPSFHLNSEGKILALNEQALVQMNSSLHTGQMLLEEFESVSGKLLAPATADPVVRCRISSNYYRISQRELENQEWLVMFINITDLIHSQNDLDLQNRRFEAILNSLDGLLFEIDQEGRYRNVWAKQDSNLFVPKDVFLGKLIREVFEEDFANAAMAILRKAIDTGVTQSFEYPGLGDLSNRWYKAEMSPVATKSGEMPLVTLYVHDITEVKSATQKLENNIRLMDSIRQAQEEYFLTGHPAKAFTSMLEEFLRVTNSQFGFIGEVLYQEGQPYLKTHSITNISWDEESQAFYDQHAVDGVEFRNLQTLFGHTLRTGEPVITNHPKKHPASSGTPKGHPPLVSYCGLPLFSNHELVGMIGIANNPDGYTNDLMQVLRPTLYAYGLLIRTIRTSNQYQTALAAEQKAKLEAEAANQEKANFLSVMSHEIRTPLNAVVGLSEILEMGDPRPDQEEYVQSLRFSAENLLNLVNDILDFSKIDAGKLELENIPFSLNGLLQQLSSAFKFKAAEKGLEWHLDLDQSVPAHLVGDPVRLAQIFSNLLSNATKFTERGGIQLKTKLLEKGENSVRVLCAVSDTGQGIPHDKHHSIFEMFTQADNSTARQHGGTGLGLTITRKLLQLMNSDISLRSLPNQGSTFSFELEFPQHQQEHISDLNEPQHDQAVDLSGKTILVVDDNPINLLVASQFLKKWGAQVDTVESGPDALNACQMKTYDLVFMDLRMPGKDGIETTRELKRSNPDQLVIALTASAALERKEEVLEVGMVDFISKPFSGRTLAQKLKLHLKL